MLSGEPRLGWRDSDPDWQFRVGDETLEQLITEDQAVCEESRRVAAGRGLDDTGAHPRMGTVSLRWIYVHMLEEVARHSGHLDILVEQLDCRASYLPAAVRGVGERRSSEPPPECQGRPTS